MAIPLKLQVFEGPMDLLMHLIEKNKIDIYDIPIVTITDQYLDYVHQMEHNDMNVTSEFLVMAATLLDIKSRMLLPREENEEGEEEDPRDELVRRLLEYKMYKYMSEELKEKNRQKEELNRKIAELIRQQTRKQDGAGKKTGGGSSKTTSTAVDTKLSNEFAANKGRLPWPVEGTIMERFGKHSHPVYKNVQLPQNNGVTLVVKHGAQAKAVFNGTVSQIVVLPGYNQCVLVNHGEYFTLYSKLKSVSVKAGQKITVGQVVGTVDTIGGEDLFHFELWKGSTPQNPESWLRQ